MIEEDVQNKESNEKQIYIEETLELKEQNKSDEKVITDLNQTAMANIVISNKAAFNTSSAAIIQPEKKEDEAVPSTLPTTHLAQNNYRAKVTS